MHQCFVHGDSKNFLKEKDNLSPTNTYSLSKKFNEDLAEIYSKFYGVKSLGCGFLQFMVNGADLNMFIQKY